MNKLIYILPERLRRIFHSYRRKLYPLWFRVEYANKRGKRWVPYYDLVNEIRADILIYSTEIHDSENRVIAINGDNQLFDNLIIGIASIQSVKDAHDDVKNLIKKINEDSENTEPAEEGGDDISEDAQPGSKMSF